MPLDNAPDSNGRCTHPTRHPLALDHPSVLEVRAQYADLFVGREPTDAYYCPDCDHFWIVFPLYND